VYWGTARWQALDGKDVIGWLGAQRGALRGQPPTLFSVLGKGGRWFAPPQHQISPDDAATHATVAQKRKAAEHLSFGHIRAPIEVASDTGRQIFVVGTMRAATRPRTGSRRRWDRTPTARIDCADAATRVAGRDGDTSGSA